MNTHAYYEKNNGIQNTVLYGANNVDKTDLVQPRKVFDSCLEVNGWINGTVAVYVGHDVLLKRARNYGDFRSS